jgi:hypothetical protein
MRPSISIHEPFGIAVFVFSIFGLMVMLASLSTFLSDPAKRVHRVSILLNLVVLGWNVVNLIEMYSDFRFPLYIAFFSGIIGILLTVLQQLEILNLFRVLTNFSEYHILYAKVGVGVTFAIFVAPIVYVIISVLRRNC